MNINNIGWSDPSKDCKDVERSDDRYQLRSSLQGRSFFSGSFEHPYYHTKTSPCFTRRLSQTYISWRTSTQNLWTNLCFRMSLLPEKIWTQQEQFQIGEAQNKRWLGLSGEERFLGGYKMGLSFQQKTILSQPLAWEFESSPDQAGFEANLELLFCLQRFWTEGSSLH